MRCNRSGHFNEIKSFGKSSQEHMITIRHFNEEAPLQISLSTFKDEIEVDKIMLLEKTLTQSIYKRYYCLTYKVINCCIGNLTIARRRCGTYPRRVQLGTKNTGTRIQRV